MRRLVLVKHSMPEIEPDRPASAWKLGAIGRRRSELLASNLKEYRPAVIWSSRESKAIETAEIVANKFGVPVEIVDGLEGNCSELRGQEEFAGLKEGIEAVGPPGTEEGCQSHLAIGSPP